MKKKNNKEMDVVFLLDRSGSMSGIVEDTIGGYNGYIKSIKDDNIKVTTILFDNNYEILHDRVDISKVEELDNKTYYVRGSTALLDAIGKTISYIDSKTDNKVLFIITTDGLENASIEYNKSQIKDMILKHSNWEFMYIGANIDSYSEGASIGIKSNNIANYKKDKRGVSNLFGAVAKASKCYCASEMLDESWKQDLE